MTQTDLLVELMLAVDVRLDSRAGRLELLFREVLTCCQRM
jgi:hypothetical protein